MWLCVDFFSALHLVILLQVFFWITQLTPVVQFLLCWYKLQTCRCHVHICCDSNIRTCLGRTPHHTCSRITLYMLYVVSCTVSLPSSPVSSVSMFPVFLLSFLALELPTLVRSRTWKHNFPIWREFALLLQARSGKEVFFCFSSTLSYAFME